MSDKALHVSLQGLDPHVGGRDQMIIHWVVPEGWRTEVLELPAGSVVDLDVELTTIDDGILVQVHAESDEDTALRGECVRCLDPVSVAWWVNTSELYDDPVKGKRRRSRSVDDEIEAEGDELDTPLRVEDDHVDIERPLRDAILAAAPLQPLCGPECLGLCEHCGVRLADAAPDHHHEFFDPRFASLEGFFEHSREEEQ